MTKQNFKNLQEMNQILKGYSAKGEIKPSVSSGFLIKSGKLVIRFTDSTNWSADLCIGYFEANSSSVNIVNKLIMNYSR